MLSAAGNMLLGVSKEDIFSASYTGELALSDFSSIDKKGGEDFLKWKNLSLKGVEVGSNPVRATVKTAGVNDFFARVAISSEKKINLLEIFETGAAGEPAGGRTMPSGDGKSESRAKGKTESSDAKKSGDTRQRPQIGASVKKTGSPSKIEIDRITLQGGKIAFSDNYIKPAFHAEMLDIEGKITGVSSGKDALADINLQGRLYGNSPLQITGKVNPFGDQLSADISVKFKNIDMTRWNPYARKYVGYTLEKGNLHLELKYVIVNNALDFKNDIVLDRLTLGEKVESPDATALPVKFAISLLQDRKGEIRLGVPVKGNIDDPQFDLGQVIKSAIQNFIFKAVTAPFALLGALLPQGSGGEIDSVEMDDASGKLTEAAAKKLSAIAAILYERPNLELDIQGCVDPIKGKEIVIRDLFDKKLRAQKLKEMMKKGEGAPSIEQVSVSTDEYQKYLKMAYREEFPKEGLKKLDFISKTPPEEMKNRLLSTIHVTDEDLRALAFDWGMKVKAALLESGKVEPRQLFILEPDIAGLGDAGKSKKNGVILKLK
jgi:hypothetical protein